MRRELAMGQGTDSTTSTTSTSTGRTPEQARKTAAGLTYLSGFGNEHSSEAEPGALPSAATRPSVPRWGCTRSS